MRWMLSSSVSKRTPPMPPPPETPESPKPKRPKTPKSTPPQTPAKPTTQGKKFDLNAVTNTPEVRVTGAFNVQRAEDEAERDSRLRIEEADASHKRWRETCTTIAAVIGLALAGFFCGSVALSATASPDDKKWATAAIFAI